MKFISFGRWYYNHSSTHMPTLVTMDGLRSDWGKVSIALDAGHSVEIRPATGAEHDEMLKWFDEIVDENAKTGWVYGIGNFNPKEPPPGVADAVAGIKARARTEGRGL